MGHSPDSLHLRHGGRHLLDILDMDLEPIPEHLGGQAVHQIVLLPPCLKILQCLRPCDKGDLGHIGDSLDFRLKGPGLLLRVAVVNVGQEQILVLQVPQHVVQVDRQQGEGTHDQQAGHDHAHSGKGHEAVGEDRVEALAEIVFSVKSSRHCCNTRLSRR